MVDHDKTMSDPDTETEAEKGTAMTIDVEQLVRDAARAELDEGGDASTVGNAVLQALTDEGLRIVPLSDDE
jgi:hypothetical protein